MDYGDVLIESMRVRRPLKRCLGKNEKRFDFACKFIIKI